MNQGVETVLKAESIGKIQNSLNVGYFVFLEENEVLMFQDSRQKLHDISRVMFLSGDSDLNNGEKKLPKPYLVGSAGEVKEYGANVLYSFIDNSEADIMVFGAVNRLNIGNADDKLNFDLSNYNDLEARYLSRNNIKRYYSVSEDAEGNLSVYLEGKNNNGNVSLKIFGNGSESNGNLKIEANGKIVLNQVNDNEELVSQIFIDNESTTIFSPKIRILNSDESLRGILLNLLQSIKDMTLKHPQGPTVAVPINWSDFEAVKTSIENLMEN